MNNSRNSSQFIAQTLSRAIKIADSGVMIVKDMQQGASFCIQISRLNLLITETETIAIYCQDRPTLYRKSTYICKSIDGELVR